MTPLRIVFAGSPAAAVPSLNALAASAHELVAVVTREDSPQGRKRVLTPTPVAHVALEHGLPVVKANRLAPVADELAALEPDLGVVVAYGGLIREPLLSAPRLGWINLHFSLLPRWRGAAPVQRAIMAGDTETGVAVFRLVEDLDAGPVYAMERHRIGANQTAGHLLEQLARGRRPVRARRGRAFAWHGACRRADRGADRGAQLHHRRRRASTGQWMPPPSTRGSAASPPSRALHTRRGRADQGARRLHRARWAPHRPRPDRGARAAASLPEPRAIGACSRSPPGDARWRPRTGGAGGRQPRQAG
ncbi:MAG: methionyl-tRNA formyltransferase [Schumannella sp.]